jgi:UDP-N-acetylglucosamine:LPS N-acetylglucosamine transferase
VKPSAGARRTIVFAANSAWNILNFRMNLVRALAAEGLNPVALVPPGEGETELKAAGVPVVTILMSADDTSPLSGFMLVVRYIRALRRIRPAAFLGFTPKPNIFGSMAASALKIPVINNVTGLGTAFIHGGVLGTLVPNLYRIALRRSHRVFFHNEEDEKLFLEKGMAPSGKTAVIPGSGVDLQRFTATPLPGVGDGLTFLFIGRLL